jgi:hypothetical protein
MPSSDYFDLSGSIDLIDFIALLHFPDFPHRFDHSNQTCQNREILF